MTIVNDIDIGRALAAASDSSRDADLPRARRQAIVMLKEEDLISPLGCHGSLPVCEVNGDRLDFGEGRTLRTSIFAALSPRIEEAAAVACTLGPALEARVALLCADRKLSLALALDELGNELLSYVCRLVTLKMRREARLRGHSAGNMLTTAGGELPFEQQETVIAMAGAGRIGITVTDEGGLFPAKSRMHVVGFGKGLGVQPKGRRCEGCALRRECRHRIFS